MRTWLRGWLMAILVAVLAGLGGVLQGAEDNPPLTLDSILKLKAAEITDTEIGSLVDKRGVGFPFTADTAEKLITGGCGTDLIKKIRDAAKAAKDTPTATTPDPKPKADTPRQPGRDADGLMPGMTDDDPLPAAKPKASADDDDPLPPVEDDPLPKAEPKPKVDKPVAVAPKPPANNPLKKANPIDELEKTTEAAPEIFYGPRAPEEKQNAVAERIKDILKGSGLKLEVNASKHITLIASADNAKKYLPDMKVLEQKLEQRFPGAIKTGPDKRSAIIVLVDSQDDYKTWIKAEFTGLGLDKPAAEGQGGGDQLQMALNARGHFLRFVGVTDLSAFNNDNDRHKSVAYSMGYLYMHALTEGHAPDCFVTGFGNYCESLMYTDPMTRVYSYEERTIAANSRARWVNQMKDVIQGKTASNSDEVLGFSTVTMKAVNYVEAWSLISFLTGRPKEFDAIVTALRDKNGAMKAITAYFKYDNKNLEYYWKTWANTQN